MPPQETEVRATFQCDRPNDQFLNRGVVSAVFTERELLEISISDRAIEGIEETFARGGLRHGNKKIGGRSV
jgi:hypothetical protein